MKKLIKLISMLLTVIMLLGAMSALFTIEMAAAETESTAQTETETESGSTETETEGPKVKLESIDYTKEIYVTPEDKLATMRLALEKEGYQLYVNDYTGEVACVDTRTGERLFTNPYDVGASTGGEETKWEILSQIIVKFTDQQGQEKTFTSYEQAAKRGQIVTEPIKSGLRVEYTIGREQTKVLVPRLMSYERFVEMIWTPLYEEFGDELYNMDTEDVTVHHIQGCLLTKTLIYSKDYLDMSAAEKKKLDACTAGVKDGLVNSDGQWIKATEDYPIVERMPVCIILAEASEHELAQAEEIIMTYCTEYSYEELDYDHSLTEYEAEDENPPVFRMALEYKLDADGLTVRLPANGIRFNESLYTLEYIEVLPYMGAGNSGYEGYNFFPDGSGTLFDYEELNTKQTRSVQGKVYGTDFAYHEISGTYQKAIRYPVFGIVEDYNYYTYEEIKYNDDDEPVVKLVDTIAGSFVDTVKEVQAGLDPDIYKGTAKGMASLIAEGPTIGKTIADRNYTETKVEDKRGFLAIIEEGDALASLATYHAGSLSDYNTIKMSFTPRPKDTYDLKDALSAGAASEWTVVSDRKYVGGYKIRYVMLTDADEAAEKGIEDIYDASWFGMAVAYRDYLTEKGVLSKLTAEELTEDIPLYIETFGTVETVEKFLSIPVTVMAPLTTFDDVWQIYSDLKEQGISNVNFKLTGFANGGMYYHVPGKLKFEKVVGGNDGFQTLLDKAAENNASDKNSNLGIFPDFDFAYSIYDKAFDGYSNSKHAVRTIDDRYASKRVYSATTQQYMNYYELAISPAYFSTFYDKLWKNYKDEYNNVTGISVASLGYSLNSDFDEDEPYNREDSKKFTIDAFRHFNYWYDEVMTEGGNAYVWEYVDHMLDVSLDSSRYNFSSNAVPFIGVVLHGSVSFAGEPLNMEGDLQYAILKAIENGASPYFILSARNTQALKDYFDLSQYYSIRYDIWKKDIADVYDSLNDALFDVQDKYITNHEFLTGSRIPDSDEFEADILNEYYADLENERNAVELLAQEIALLASIARENGREAVQYAASAVLEAYAIYDPQMKNISDAIIFDLDFYNKALNSYRALEEVKAYASYRNSQDPEEKALYQEYVKVKDIHDIVTNFNMAYDDVLALYEEYEEKMAAVAEYGAADYKRAHDEIKDLYGKYASTPTVDNLKAVTDILETNGEKAELYQTYLATEKAFKAAKSTGFAIGYDESFEIYLAAERADFYSKNYKKLATSANATAQDIANYEAYFLANLAVKDLENKIKSIAPELGSMDEYVLTRAQVAVMKEFNYDTSEDASKINEYTRARSQLESKRRDAISAVAKAETKDLKNLQAILETLEDWLDKATEAVNTLAEVEGVTIQYAEGSEKTVLDIINRDEIAAQSLIVDQAIERALTVIDYLERDNYEEIKESKLTEYTLNGHTLRQTRDENNEKLYYYGTYETGYSYFKMVTDAETGESRFEIVLKGQKDGNKTSEGVELYNFVENGVKKYYTATLETGYTYYIQDKIYDNRFVKAEPIVYNGEQVAELADGTVIYCDESQKTPVYYSVNEDGTYTRYNVHKAVRTYCETAINESAEMKALAFALGDAVGDADFAVSVQKRIDRTNDATKEEVVEEEEIISDRYATENLVAVTYGNDNGTAYKTMLLNYNNYAVRVVYNGFAYTIPAYEFVVIKW